MIPGLLFFCAHGTISLKIYVECAEVNVMAGKIIMWIVCFGCGLLFFGIGAYARKLKTPMWFWSGTTVDASQITDVTRYNKENGTMWQLYSLWYFAAGAAVCWEAAAAVVFLVAGCSVGLWLLVRSYQRIYGKYRVK